MNQHDKTVLELQAVIKDKKENLVKPDRYSFNTNMTLKLGSSSPMPLNTFTIEGLTKAYAALLVEFKSFQEARIELNVDILFTNGGFSIYQWKEDIKHKISVLKYNEEIKKLEALEARVLALESTDLKTQKELETIMKLLGV